MSILVNNTEEDHYLILGLEPGAAAAEIRARIETKREQLGRLRKIPKKRAETELRLLRLAASERVLLDPTKRADYDVRLQAGEKSADAMLPVPLPQTSERSEPGTSQRLQRDSCKTCGADLVESASFCDECGTAVPCNEIRAVPTRELDTGWNAVSSKGKSVARADECAPILLPRAVFEIPLAKNRGRVGIFVVFAAILLLLGGAVIAYQTSTERTSNSAVPRIAANGQDASLSDKPDPRASKEQNAIGLRILSAARPDFEGAKQAFEKAVQLNAANVEALNNLGYVHGRMGDYRVAESILIKVLDIAPTRRIAQGNLGCIQAKLGKTFDASNHFCQFAHQFASHDNAKAALMKIAADPDPEVHAAIVVTFKDCTW